VTDTTKRFDAGEIEAGIKALIIPGQLYELRILHWEFTESTSAGWLDDPKKLATALARCSGRAPGIYLSLNPVDPQYFGNKNLMCKEVKKTTLDSMITKREWLFIDIDPERPSKTCATDSEKAKAYEVMNAVLAYLSEQGWPGCYLIDSGNGFQARYKISVPNNEESKLLVKSCLHALSSKFTTAEAKIDLSVFNAARIARFPGTMNCKGENTPERPWRISKLITREGMPEVTEVPLEKLKELAALAPKPERTERQAENHGTGTGDDLGKTLEGFARLCPDFEFQPAYIGGTVNGPGYFVRCPSTITGWPDGSSHGSDYNGLDDTCVVFMRDGLPCFNCLHSSCHTDAGAEEKKTWKHFSGYFSEIALEKLGVVEIDNDDDETTVPEMPINEAATTEEDPADTPAPAPDPTPNAPPADEANPAAKKPKPERIVLGQCRGIQSTRGEDDVIVINKLVGIRLSDVEAEKLEWLWPERIVKGKISWICGKPDSGKSVMCLDLAARITRGMPWPDGAANPWGPQSVLLLANEDTPSDIIRPRLEAAGADLARVIFLDRVTIHMASNDPVTDRQMQLDQDAFLLKDSLKRNPDVAMVLADPATAFFGDCDINKNEEIGPVLGIINTALEGTKAAFVGILHLNKRTDADSGQRILGASSVYGTARSAWGVSLHPEDKELHLMSRIKGNLSKNRKGLKFKIVDATVVINGEKETVPKVEWLGDIDEDADELIQQERDKKRNGGEQTALGKAKRFLLWRLKDGAVLPSTLMKEAKYEDISESSLWRVKKETPLLDTYKIGEKWYWSLVVEKKPEQILDSVEGL
jgi:hypothetical protein